MMIAVNLGFNQALIVAIGLYITAILFLFCDSVFRDSRRMRQTHPTSVEPAIRN
jgi:hypothetical protein